jgi:hypothetical protein
MGNMSASDAAPLPRLGEVFFDVRGESRSMRLSWYADTGVAVFSIWQGGTCTGTFRLPIADLPRMVEALRRGPNGHGHPDLAEQPAEDSQRSQRRRSPPPPGGAGDTAQATAALQVPPDPLGGPGPAGGRHSARRPGDEFGAQRQPGDADYPTALAGGLPPAPGPGYEDGGPVADHHTSPPADYRPGPLSGHRGGRPTDYQSGPQPGYHTGAQHAEPPADYRTEPPAGHHTGPQPGYHTGAQHAEPPADYLARSPADYGTQPPGRFPPRPEPRPGRYPAGEDEPGYEAYPGGGGEPRYAGSRNTAGEPDYPGPAASHGYPDPLSHGHRAAESPARPYVAAAEPVPADPFGERSRQHRHRSRDERDEPSFESFPYGAAPRARQPHPRERYTARD